eukprot:scaffold2134_cov384-Prasinococcus_capsulatus_cf.AAC.4
MAWRTGSPRIMSTHMHADPLGGTQCGKPGSGPCERRLMPSLPRGASPAPGPEVGGSVPRESSSFRPPGVTASGPRTAARETERTGTPSIPESDTLRAREFAGVSLRYENQGAVVWPRGPSSRRRLARTCAAALSTLTSVRSSTCEASRGLELLAGLPGVAAAAEAAAAAKMRRRACVGGCATAPSVGAGGAYK